MTDQTTKSRRFDLRFAALIFTLVSHSVVAKAAISSPRLPIIQNVGVIPVQWEGSYHRLPVKDLISQEFSAAVRASHRFRVLGDDLIAEQWQTEKGRSDLREQYEAQGLLSLTVAVRDDVTTFSVRMVDLDMHSDLLESETIDTNWFNEAKSSDIKDKLESLVFRLVNRLPVDVSVTSIQGHYITLSGGTEQNLAVGDRVELVRTAVRSLHPANGTWLEFSSKPTGVAQVVDVKSTTAVAKILNQTYDQAIEVGDGAKIKAIASRVKFARLAANQGLKDAGRQPTVIVSPIYVPGMPQPSIVKTSDPEQPPVTVDQPSEAGANLGGSGSDVSIGEVSPANKVTPVAPGDATSTSPAATDITRDDSGMNLWDDITKEATSHRLIEHAQAYAGPSLWRLSGGGITGTSSKMPMLLINNIGANVTRNLMFRIRNDFGAQLMSGSTTNGRFGGYRGLVRIYWDAELPAIVAGFIHGWRGGGLATINGLSVSNESFGGGDWFSAGGFAGLYGQIPSSLLGERYDWQGEFSLIPVVIGRLGLGGKWQRVQSAFATQINFAVTQYRPAHILAWGAGIDIGNSTLSMGNNQTVSLRNFDLQVLAKYRF